MGLIFKLLSAIPGWTYIIIAAVLWGGYGHLKADSYKKQLADYKQKLEQANKEAESFKRLAARKVEDKYAAKAKEAIATSMALADANNRLRDALAGYTDTTRDAIAVCGVDGSRGRKLEELLQRSAALAAEGARRVESLGAKVEGLQGYISEVCVKNGPH